MTWSLFEGVSIEEEVSTGGVEQATPSVVTEILPQTTGERNALSF